MIKNSSTLINPRESVLVFISTLIVSAFWLSSLMVNVYDESLGGAVYDFVSVVMLLALFGLPFLTLKRCIRNRFNSRSLYLYSFLLSLITVLILFTQID